MATFSKRFPRYLAFASEDTPLRISRIPLAHLRAACAERGLLEGDRVRRIGAFTDHILLRGPNGARILLESRLAAAVEIEPAALVRL
ncbi:MAG TPA: hypothetical protein VGJ18_03540 [Gemmatimonadaceae bacterium]|jgi:hypothetical protein